MKKSLLLIAMTYPCFLVAQPLDERDWRVDPFVGVNIKFTSFNTVSAILYEGRAGISAGEFIKLGVSFTGMLDNNLIIDNRSAHKQQSLFLWYGGIHTGISAYHDNLASINFPVNISFGQGRVTNTLFDTTGSQQTFLSAKEEKSAFMVIEPGVEFYINISRKVKIGAGFSYRFLRKSEFELIEQNKLSGAAMSLNLHFGL